MPKEIKIENLKEALVLAMQEHLGIVTDACETCKCSRGTFYKYYNSDELFKQQIDDIENIKLDFVEGKLYKLINDENPSAIFFYLNNKGKKRGY